MMSRPELTWRNKDENKKMELDQEKIRVGVSTCLLGENVRFDGGHKKNDYVLHTLSDFFEWVPVCPEVDIGLGTPRESLRLVGDAGNPRFVTGKSNIDHTEKMVSYSDRKVEELQKLNLNGYILKKDSPSCGMERVRVYDESGMPNRKGVGIFARALMERMPLLPVEEEGRLNDLKLRENFIVRVFCHYRWQKIALGNFSVNALVQFHTQHKFLLMAHSEKHLRELGRLVADAKKYPPRKLKEKYVTRFFEALRRKSTHRKHTNVLQHILGYFKKDIDDRDRHELLQTIEEYRQGLLPLIVPITLIKHYVNKFDVQYIKDQVYLNPHPKELMLLNHV